MNPEDKITYFAESDARGKKTRFGIKARDRARHVYVVGKTGMGKSTLLENMAVQDIQGGEGMAFIDPHGGTADKLLEYIPEHRIKDVVYFAPFDLENPISFNVLEDIGFDKRHLVVSGLMSTFKKIWVDAWSARMEYILNNTLLALLETPGTTLLDVNRMLSEKDYRKEIVGNVQDPSVKAFWVKEFANYTERMAAEAVPAIQNKIGQFTANPIIRNILGQPKSSFDVRKMMDEKKILIINLSKGQIGEQNAALLGGMIITKIYLAAMSRADVSGLELAKLPQFYFYVDEFQSFANATFADILSEARKYKLNLTIAHQYIEQMEEEVRDAVFGNVGTTITFRVGPFDAEVLEKIFLPTFNKEDIVNLGFAQIYLTLMIDGIGSRPFSATTLGPIPLREDSNKELVIKSSQGQFGAPRAVVQERIMKSFEPAVPQPKVRVEGSSTKPERLFPDDRPTKVYEKPIQSSQSRNDFPSAPRQPYPPRPSASTISSPRPSIQLERPPVRPEPPRAAAIPEKKPFANLKDMLAVLESGEAQEVPAAPVVSSRPSAPRPLMQSTRPVSLNALKKPVDTAPTQNRSALKDLLANVTKDKPATPAPLKKEESRNETILKQATAEPKPAPNAHAPSAKQEVSEDVLRKILE